MALNVGMRGAGISGVKVLILAEASRLQGCCLFVLCLQIVSSLRGPGTRNS